MAVSSSSYMAVGLLAREVAVSSSPFSELEMLIGDCGHVARSAIWVVCCVTSQCVGSECQDCVVVTC